MNQNTNEEQSEAAELNSKPRIVITPKGVLIFSLPGQELSFSRDHMLWMAALMEALEKQAPPTSEKG